MKDLSEYITEGNSKGISKSLLKNMELLLDDLNRFYSLEKNSSNKKMIRDVQIFVENSIDNISQMY